MRNHGKIYAAKLLSAKHGHSESTSSDRVSRTCPMFIDTARLFQCSRMKKRILAVDDEPLITESIASVLEGSGLYEVDYTTNAYEAFELASRKRYDLVIADLLMPGMNGDTLYLCLGVDPRDHQRTLPRPKLLLISGVADENEMRQKRQFIGAADILQKPFSDYTLLRCVNRLMWGSDAKAEAGLACAFGK